MVEKKKKELVKVVSKSPAELIAAAVSKDTDLDKLEKLLVLQERWEGNEAKKAYHRAMAAFKENPPKIEKDHEVAYGNVKYKHATLANITEKINTSLSKHGLSVSWTTKQNGAIMITCRITHVMGHSEETTLAAGADTSGSKNAIQAIGSALTYLQRYTLLSLTGLAARDMDDDGNTTLEDNNKSEVVTPEALSKPSQESKDKPQPDKNPKPKPRVVKPAKEPEKQPEAKAKEINLSMSKRFQDARKTLGEKDYLFILSKFNVKSASEFKVLAKAEEAITALETITATEELKLDDN